MKKNITSQISRWLDLGSLIREDLSRDDILTKTLMKYVRKLLWEKSRQTRGASTKA